MDFNQLGDQLTEFATNLLLATGAFALGYVLVRYVIIRFLKGFLRKYGVDEVFVSFATNIANILLILIVAVIALDIVGVNTGFLLAVLVAVLLAVVAAMQGRLQDVAAGLWMFFTNPFKLNDLVKVAGAEGRVQRIDILTTTLRTRDNLILTLPNRTIVSNIITNFHAEAERRIELEVEISYEDDIRQAIDVLRQVVTSDERILAEPEPIIAVADLAANGVKLHVRPWVKQEHFIATRYALREKIKYAFDANNITIPYPQLTLHTNGGEP
jgi:small conductance mechanosensitive channel